MFLNSYEKLRGKLIKDSTIISMVHLGARAFGDIGGEVVQSTSYVMRKEEISHYKGKYIRLVDSLNKQESFLKQHEKNTYVIDQKSFDDIPGTTIAYWVSDQTRKLFRETYNVGSAADPKVGMQTSDNKRFLRLWYEIGHEKMGLSYPNATAAQTSGNKWLLTIKVDILESGMVIRNMLLTMKMMVKR